MTPEEIAGMPAYAQIAYYELANLPEARRDAPISGYAYALGLLCMAYVIEKRYAEAIAVGSRARQIVLEQIPDDAAVLGHVLLNLGVAHSRSGDLAQGLPLYLESWSCTRLSDDQGTALNAAANIVTSLDMGESAGDRELAVLQECLPVLLNAGCTSDVALGYKIMGAAHISRGNAAAALRVLDTALVLTAGLGGARDFRHRVVRLIEEADRLIEDPADGPPLGPGVLGEIRALVDDGAENLERGSPARAKTCFERALTLLYRRSRDIERGLAGFLFLVVSRPSVQGVDDGVAGLREFIAGMKELERVEKDFADEVKISERSAFDLDGLKVLASSLIQSSEEGRRRKPQRRRRKWRQQGNSS